MIKRAILLGVLSIAAVACSSDPNKNVESAQDAQLKSQRQNEQAAAEARKDYTTDSAEQQRKATESWGMSPDSADQKRLKADAKMR